MKSMRDKISFVNFLATLNRCKSKANSPGTSSFASPAASSDTNDAQMKTTKLNYQFPCPQKRHLKII